MNTHISTRAVEHGENINTIKTQISNAIKYQSNILFNILDYVI